MLDNFKNFSSRLATAVVADIKQLPLYLSLQAPETITKTVAATVAVVGSTALTLAAAPESVIQWAVYGLYTAGTIGGASYAIKKVADAILENRDTDYVDEGFDSTFYRESNKKISDNEVTALYNEMRGLVIRSTSRNATPVDYGYDDKDLPAARTLRSGNGF